MKLKHFAKTDIGLKRKANEDSIGELLFNKSKYGNIYIVCDGMGGHEGGKMASETAINSIIEYFSNTPSDSPTTALKEAIEFANIQIFGKAQSDSQYKGMGTTCCVLLEKNNLIYVAHVGDSRIYISSDGKFHRVTKDHSFVQGLFDNGQISEEEIETHARKNELTQALGVSTEVNVEVCSDPILAKKGDNFLICSDGLCGLIDDNKIYNIVKKGKTNSDIGNNLIDAANNAGGTDNISVIYISIDESPHAKSQFISKNNILKDNLTKTMLLDTDQKAAILANNNFSFFNKYKNKIFISVGVLFISLLMILIVSKIGNNDVPKIETIDKTTDLELNVDEFEAQIEIDGEEVEIFYYSFKKSNDWTKENKNFEPLITNVKLTHKWDKKNDVNFQEFYWNNNFLLYDEYKTQKEILYDSDISENSFIFIRKSNLEKIPNSKPKVDSDPFQLKEEEKKKNKAKAARKAKANKKAAAKKKADTAAKNKDKEEQTINTAHNQLDSFINTISDSRNEIYKIRLNERRMAEFLKRAKQNYESQMAEFYLFFPGYKDTGIPDKLSSENLPKGIIELKGTLISKNNSLETIVKDASDNYNTEERNQINAAGFLDISKQRLKSAENLKDNFIIKYNINNIKLQEKCDDDLAKIIRANGKVVEIQEKSDEIRNKFNLIKDNLNKIKILSDNSNDLLLLVEKNTTIFLDKKKKKKK